MLYPGNVRTATVCSPGNAELVALAEAVKETLADSAMVSRNGSRSR